MCFDSCFFVTAGKEAAVTTHELTHATSTPAHEQKKRHRDCFVSTHRTYVSRSVLAMSLGWKLICLWNVTKCFDKTVSISGKFADKKKEEPTTYCTIIRPIYPSSAAHVLTHLPKSILHLALFLPMFFQRFRFLFILLHWKTCCRTQKKACLSKDIVNRHPKSSLSKKFKEDWRV